MGTFTIPHQLFWVFRNLVEILSFVFFVNNSHLVFLKSLKKIENWLAKNEPWNLFVAMRSSVFFHASLSLLYSIPLFLSFNPFFNFINSYENCTPCMAFGLHFLTLIAPFQSCIRIVTGYFI